MLRNESFLHASLQTTFLRGLSTVPQMFAMNVAAKRGGFDGFPNCIVAVQLHDLRLGTYGAEGIPHLYPCTVYPPLLGKAALIQCHAMRKQLVLTTVSRSKLI